LCQAGLGSRYMGADDYQGWREGTAITGPGYSRR